jgi:hypothetical protein
MKSKAPIWWAAAAAVLLSLLLALYLSWQSLLFRGMQRWLASEGWELQSLRRPAFGPGLLWLEGLELRRAGAGGSDLVLELEQVKAGFSWQGRSFDRIDIGRMKVHWQQGISEPLPWPDLPDVRFPMTELQVAQLELDLVLADGQRWEHATPVKLVQPAAGQYDIEILLQDQPGVLQLRTGMPASLELRWPVSRDSETSSINVTYAKERTENFIDGRHIKVRGKLELKSMPEEVKSRLVSRQVDMKGQLRLDLELSLGPHLGDWSRLTGRMEASEFALELNDSNNSKVQLQGRGSFQLDNGLAGTTWKVTLEPGLALNLLSRPGRKVESNVKLQQAYRMQSSIGLGRLPIQLQVEGFKALQFELDGIKLSQPERGQGMSASGRLKLKPTQIKPGWPETGIDASWQMSAGQWHTSGQLHSRDQRALVDFRADHHQSSACTDFELKHAGELNRLQEWVALAPVQLRQIQLQAGTSSGRLAGRHCLGHDKRIQASGWLQIDQGRLGWSKSSLSGLKLRLDLESLPSRQGMLRLQADQLALGAPLQLGAPRLELSSQQVSLQLIHFSAGLLGGDLSAEPSRLSWPLGSGSIPLRIEGLELEQLLRLIDLPGLEGSGRLSGRLPLSWDMRGAEIQDGQLLSTGEGRIRYQSAAAAADNIGLQALRDFHYQRLAAGLDYLADGRYRLRLRLEGHNPELYQGHPIDFNLNVNGELPGLLQGALLSGDFNTYLLKQLQQGKLE